MTLVKHCVGLFVSLLEHHLTTESSRAGAVRGVSHNLFDHQSLALWTRRDPLPAIRCTGSVRCVDVGRDPNHGGGMSSTAGGASVGGGGTKSCPVSGPRRSAMLRRVAVAVTVPEWNPVARPLRYAR